MAADFPIRTSDQLTAVLQAFRKESGMTQNDVAARMGLTQQKLSHLELNAPNVSADRLLRLLRSEEHTSELQSPCNLVCRLLLEKKKNTRASSSATLTLQTTRPSTPPAPSTRQPRSYRSRLRTAA